MIQQCRALSPIELVPSPYRATHQLLYMAMYAHCMWHAKHGLALGTTVLGVHPRRRRALLRTIFPFLRIHLEAPNQKSASRTRQPTFFLLFSFCIFLAQPTREFPSRLSAEKRISSSSPCLFLFLRPTRLETLHAAPTHPCRVPKSSRAAATMFLLTTICGDLLGEGSKEAGSYRAGKWKPHIEYNAAPCVTSTHARAYYGSATSPLGIFGNSGGPLNTMAWGMPGGHRVVEEHRPPRRGP